MNNYKRILATASLFFRPSLGIHELRILGSGKGIFSGYYDNPEALARDAAVWDGKADGIYITANPVNPDLLARSMNRLKLRPKQTTKDDDTTSRSLLIIDVDPVRPSGISSTDADASKLIKQIIRALDARFSDAKDGRVGG